MAKFTFNKTRIDPYKNFKFRVKSNGKPVTGTVKASAPKKGKV